MRTKASVTYIKRTLALKRLGFRNYREYLRSPLWFSIRREVLKQRTCCSCRKRRSTQVHHSKYDDCTLSGESLVHLHPVCRKCHTYAERDKGRKTTLEEANERLGLNMPAVKEVRLMIREMFK